LRHRIAAWYGQEWLTVVYRVDFDAVSIWHVRYPIIGSVKIKGN
jgi:hypothetical protein